MKTQEIYNKTQLHPENCLERHVFHRDQFAHIFRWTHVLKRAELGMNILDVGCGSGNLAELLYRNRYKSDLYLGLDIRKQTIALNREKFKNVPWVKFEQADIVENFPQTTTGLGHHLLVRGFRTCRETKRFKTSQKHCSTNEQQDNIPRLNTVL